jgi:hypothetical protein
LGFSPFLAHGSGFSVPTVGARPLKVLFRASAPKAIDMEISWATEARAPLDVIGRIDHGLVVVVAGQRDGDGDRVRPEHIGQIERARRGRIAQQRAGLVGIAASGVKIRCCTPPTITRILELNARFGTMRVICAIKSRVPVR